MPDDTQDEFERVARECIIVYDRCGNTARKCIKEIGDGGQP
jgi:hypothetical protein